MQHATLMLMSQICSSAASIALEFERHGDEVNLTEVFQQAMKDTVAYEHELVELWTGFMRGSQAAQKLHAELMQPPLPVVDNDPVGHHAETSANFDLR